MIMKANELRIGNIIYFPFHSETVKVLGLPLSYELGEMIQVETKGTILCELLLKQFKPIPLTEEWLDKFSFSRGGYDMLEVWHKNNPRFTMAGYLDEEDDCLGWNYNHNGTMKECEDSLIEIKYVHQLQNLYFALTGKDLTY